jgi:hypothetical protein
MRIVSFSEHYADIQAAFGWMVSLGVKISQGRIDKYREDCTTISEHSEAGTTKEMLVSHDYIRLMNSVIESHEIVGIWKGLRSIQDPKLVEDLKHVPWGQTMLKDEVSDRSGSKARNDAFHLYFKSLLVRAGFPVTPHHRCDIVLNYEGQEYMIECKRPFRDNGVEESLQKAKRQLRDHYKEDPRRRGFIALSVSRIPNPGTKEIRADTREEMSVKTAQAIREIYDRHVHLVDKIKEPETLGVIVYLKAPVILGKLLMLSDSILFDPFRPEGKGFVEVLQSKLGTIPL